MKTIDVCSNCFNPHNWREIDYDNVLYISEKSAICLTLCQSCTAQFIENQQRKSSLIKEYKQKVENMLEADKVPVMAHNNAILGWFGKAK